jgi:hypothetical protein
LDSGTSNGALAALRQVCDDMRLDDPSARPEAFTLPPSDDAASAAASAAGGGGGSNPKAKGGKGRPAAKGATATGKKRAGPLAGLLVLAVARDGSCVGSGAASGGTVDGEGGGGGKGVVQVASCCAQPEWAWV